MEIKLRAILTKDDIVHMVRDYINKQGYEIYVGTHVFLNDENGQFKQIECEIFKEKNK